MSVTGEAIEQVLAWRAGSGRVRLGQATFVASLAWVAIGVWPAIAWISASVVTAVLDSLLCRASLALPEDKPRRIAACASMTLAAGAFTAIAFPLLAQHTHAALAEAGL